RQIALVALRHLERTGALERRITGPSNHAVAKGHGNIDPVACHAYRYRIRRIQKSEFRIPVTIWPLPQVQWRPTPVQWAASREGKNSGRWPSYSAKPRKPPMPWRCPVRLLRRATARRRNSLRTVVTDRARQNSGVRIQNT